MLACRQMFSLMEVFVHSHTLILLMAFLVRICTYFVIAIERDVFFMFLQEQTRISHILCMTQRHNLLNIMSSQFSFCKITDLSSWTLKSKIKIQHTVQHPLSSISLQIRKNIDEAEIRVKWTTVWVLNIQTPKTLCMSDCEGGIWNRFADSGGTYSNIILSKSHPATHPTRRTLQIVSCEGGELCFLCF